MIKSLVVDSSVAIKWFVSEADSDTANLVFDEYLNGNFDLLAPDLVYAEFGNIIWKKHIFQGFDLADAEVAIAEFQKIPFILARTDELFDDAFRIAVKFKRSFYDSVYLALAERENCSFVTADEKLINAIKPNFPNVIWLSDWK